MIPEESFLQFRSACQQMEEDVTYKLLPQSNIHLVVESLINQINIFLGSLKMAIVKHGNENRNVFQNVNSQILYRRKKFPSTDQSAWNITPKCIGF